MTFSITPHPTIAPVGSSGAVSLHKFALDEIPGIGVVTPGFFSYYRNRPQPQVALLSLFQFT
jgi:hypothetical protein